MEVFFSNSQFEISLNKSSEVNLIYMNNSNIAYSQEDITFSSKQGLGTLFNINTTLFPNISIGENIFLNNYPKKFFNLFINERELYRKTIDILRVFRLKEIISSPISSLKKEELFALKLANCYVQSIKSDFIVFPASIDLIDTPSRKFFNMYLEFLSSINKKVFIFTNNFNFDTYKNNFTINFIGDNGTIKAISNKIFYKNKKYFETFILNKNIHESIFSSLDELQVEDDFISLKGKIEVEGKKIFSCDSSFAVFFDRDFNKNILSDTNHYIILKKDHLKSKAISLYSNQDFIKEHIKCSNKINTIIISPIHSKKKHIGAFIMLYRIKLFNSSQSKKTVYDNFKAPLELFSRHISIFVENTTTSNNHLILNEAHHRIKNNLQSVINLIEVEKSSMADDNNIEVLDKVGRRINSIALIHNKLCYKTNYAETLNIKEIIEELIELNRGFLNGVHINLLLKDYYYPYNKVISLSLIFNEIITNSIKYSFNDSRIDSSLSIKMFSSFHYNYFIFGDRGSKNTSNTSTSSFGTTLMKGLVKHDLKGEFTMTIDENTSKAIIKIPKIAY